MESAEEVGVSVKDTEKGRGNFQMSVIFFKAVVQAVIIFFSIFG